MVCEDSWGGEKVAERDSYAEFLVFNLCSTPALYMVYMQVFNWPHGSLPCPLKPKGGCNLHRSLLLKNDLSRKMGTLGLVWNLYKGEETKSIFFFKQ